MLPQIRVGNRKRGFGFAGWETWVSGGSGKRQEESRQSGAPSQSSPWYLGAEDISVFTLLYMETQGCSAERCGLANEQHILLLLSQPTNIE